jgi:hypothetical protein
MALHVVLMLARLDMNGRCLFFPHASGFMLSVWTLFSVSSDTVCYLQVLSNLLFTFYKLILMLACNWLLLVAVMHINKCNYVI